MWRRALLLVVGMMLSGCVRGTVTRCERVCKLEADCAEMLELAEHDSGCVDACTELERDPATQRLLSEHVHCVTIAATCADVLECR